MGSRKNSLEYYKRAGAKIRLAKLLLNEAYIDVTLATTKKDAKCMKRILDDITELSSVLDNKMFQSHPNLSNDYTNVFYGAFESNPINEVDAEVFELAKKSVSFCLENK